MLEAGEEVGRMRAMAARSLLETAWLTEPSCAYEAVAVLEAAQLTCGSTAKAASGLNLSAEQLTLMIAPEAPSKVRTTVRQLLERAFALGDLAWSHHPSLNKQKGGEGHEEGLRIVPAHLEAGPGREAAGDSLREKELAKKNLWVEELILIARRAGPAAELPSKLFQQYGDQVGEMMSLALGRSAPGTLEGHVLRWKKHRGMGQGELRVCLPHERRDSGEVHQAQERLQARSVCAGCNQGLSRLAL